MDFRSQVEFRTMKIEGVNDDRWMWPRADHGASHGPVTDWNNSHHSKYFKNLKRQGTCITAGANMGLYTRYYAKVFDSVYAFEPHWLNFYCLSYNCPYPHVYKLQAALGNVCSQVEMDEKPIKNMGSYRTTPKPGDPRNTIPMLTIDTLNLPRVDFIQLDVEGFEAKVIEGAVKTIERDKPVIVMERPRDEATKIIFAMGYVFQEKSISDHVYYCNK